MKILPTILTLALATQAQYLSADVAKQGHVTVGGGFQDKTSIMEIGWLKTDFNTNYASIELLTPTFEFIFPKVQINPSIDANKKIMLMMNVNII